MGNITYNYTTVNTVNPFDGSTNTTIEVYCTCDCGSRAKETYSFPEGTAESAIVTFIHSDFVDKGYPV